MGLDIYFRKQRHQGMYDAIAELNEQRTKFVNAEYELSETQHDIVEKAYDLIHSLDVVGVDVDCVNIDAILGNFCKPIYNDVVNTVQDILAKYNDDELNNEIAVSVPVKVADADTYFDMGKFEKTEVAYFRKVNFLLPFFGYEENCSDLEIEKCQVKDIVDVCTRILEIKENQGIDEAVKIADEELATEGGFFFGSTEYDECYFNDVEDVLNKFTTILNETDWDNETVYMHCWW